MHWNNPLLRSDYTDSSGITFYLTPNIRQYDAGVLSIGQAHLEIPPGQVAYSTDGGCPGSCTSTFMDGPVYVTEAFNHMHYLGAAQRTRLVRDNVTIDLAWDKTYSYDSPVFHVHENPVTVNPGDNLLTTCTFRSTSRTVTTYYGESTSAEMCFAFLIYYPKQNLRSSSCAMTMSISRCDWHTGVIQGCDMEKLQDPTNPEMQALYVQIWQHCAIGRCKSECLPIVREVKQHPCFSGDISRIFRNKIEDRHQSSQDANEIIMYAKLDSCDYQLAQAQCPTTCKEDQGDNGITDGAVPLRIGLAAVLAIVVGTATIL